MAGVRVACEGGKASRPIPNNLSALKHVPIAFRLRHRGFLSAGSVLITAASEVTPARVANLGCRQRPTPDGFGPFHTFSLRTLHAGHSLMGLGFGLEGAAHTLHRCRRLAVHYRAFAGSNAT